MSFGDDSLDARVLAAEDTEDAGGLGCPVVEPSKRRELFRSDSCGLGGSHLRLAGRGRERRELIEAAARNPSQYLIVGRRPAGRAGVAPIFTLEPERSVLPGIVDVPGPGDCRCRAISL